jgi:hypothetical protein
MNAIGLTQEPELKIEKIAVKLSQITSPETAPA